MKKLMLALIPLCLLTGCPDKDEKEATTIMDELSGKKVEAEKVIDAKSWTLDELLTAHDYFFNFAERVHLLKEEPDSAKSVQKYVKKKGAKTFCEGFVMPIGKWQILESYCSEGEFYKCSPEIQGYSEARKKMLELLDADTVNAFNKEPACGS